MKFLYTLLSFGWTGANFQWKHFYGAYLFFATQRGQVKKTKMGEYDSSLRSGLIAINLKPNDELVRVIQTDGKSDIFMVSRNGSDVTIDVIDNGIGLPKENRNRLLEPYVTTREKGTGLGLAISRELAVLLGGEIKLASTYGQGSTFTLFLPLHYSGPDNVRTAPAAGSFRRSGSPAATTSASSMLTLPMKSATNRFFGMP